MTRLIPARYRCREHDRDLTNAVLSKVDEDPKVTANLGQRATKDGIVETGTFTVDVSCPGADSPHALRFMGSYER